mmetsp:Transcript_100455/g.122992  ORF Transcript_100455/g.122992 Transcript_100455/m.122992 type:complete len:90 (-) Transcript_100455:12-281(-)
MDQFGQSGATQADMERAAGLLQMQQVIQGQKATMKILGHCFERCVDTPEDSLAYKDQQCIWNCTQRLFDSEQFMVKRLNAAQKAKGGGL